jgi:hypothetical protein
MKLFKRLVYYLAGKYLDRTDYQNLMDDWFDKDYKKTSQEKELAEKEMEAYLQSKPKFKEELENMPFPQLNPQLEEVYDDYYDQYNTAKFNEYFKKIK